MIFNRVFTAAAILLPLGLLLSQPSQGQEAAAEKTKPLLDVKGKLDLFKPGNDQVSVARSQDPAAPGIVVTIKPGKENYPGVHFTPPSGTWDVSEFGNIRARIVNLGEKQISCSLRVDGKAQGADFTSNTESVGLKPGATGTAKVIFGFSYGYKPASKPNPEAISNLVLFTGKSDVDQVFRIEAIEAAGVAGEKPPIKPEDVRTVPKDGVILGTGVTLDPKQLDAKEGALAEIDGSAVKLTFPAGNKPQWVSVKPALGRWDLRSAFQVKVKLKNTGTAAITPKVRVNSDPGSTDTISSPTPLSPGSETEIAVSFAPAAPWLGVTEVITTSGAEGQKGTGTKFANDKVGSVTVSVEPGQEPRALLVSSIVAGVPASPKMPEWLGKRPPVEGDWVQTFTEEFDGPAIDETKWNLYTANYWDKRSHFSKDNVLLGGGVVKLRFEKKKGFHNDNPSEKQTDYATGFLNTYGKWVQRYGYFEARMKLPTAPGLWPAFWLMPDRGVPAGPQWKRANIGDGGMEFDIFEYLSRWGPYRYNVAFHWDGYGKEHKATGSTCLYAMPDKDGFLTAGLLWTPGLAVYYANGVEVARWENPRVSNVQSEIIFTHVSGGWDNNGIDDSKLPDDFVVDYVRVWQRKDLASEVDGKQTAVEPPAAESAAPKPAAP